MSALRMLYTTSLALSVKTRASFDPPQQACSFVQKELTIADLILILCPIVQFKFAEETKQRQLLIRRQLKQSKYSNVSQFYDISQQKIHFKILILQQIIF
jgi:hypothetical protein